MVLGVQFKVSLTIDGEDSGGIIESIVYVCNAYNGLFGILLILNSNVAVARIVRVEKPKCKGFLV